MYCIASTVGDQLLSYTGDSKMPKDAWTNLKKVFKASTTARNLQLLQELDNVRQKGLPVADYKARIKEICDFLASINVVIEEDEIVQVNLVGGCLSLDQSGQRSARETSPRPFSI